MRETDLIPNLFREEYGKIVAVIVRTFGIDCVDVAEDIVSDTFAKAAESWGIRGTPQNPRAWMYKVAKNRALDLIKRNAHFRDVISPHVMRDGQNRSVTINFEESYIEDSLLQMFFAICNSNISEKAQLMLALRVLCGFSINEISNALLTNREVVNKTLYRAKQNLRTYAFKTALSEFADIDLSVPRVLKIIYLLFNEGYYSTQAEVKVRKDLCLEAMRLLYLICEHPALQKGKADALMALCCFHASRFASRLNSKGDQILYKDQRRGDWDTELIEKGTFYLKRSTADTTSKYHLEAMIAYWHTRQNVPEDEKWDYILQLYNRLLQIQYSPIAALNRTFALSKVKGREVALKEALKINLSQSHLYFCLLAELYSDEAEKLQCYRSALELVQHPADQRLIEERIRSFST